MTGVQTCALTIWLPDEWELAHGLNPDNPEDAADDADHDGSTNLQEYLAGTDPRDPASALKLTVQRESEAVRLQFTSVAGRTYTVQCCDDLLDGIWEQLQVIEASPTNGIVQLAEPISAEARSRFYRLVTPALP